MVCVVIWAMVIPLIRAVIALTLCAQSLSLSLRIMRSYSLLLCVYILCCTIFPSIHTGLISTNGIWCCFFQAASVRLSLKSFLIINGWLVLSVHSVHLWKKQTIFMFCHKRRSHNSLCRFLSERSCSLCFFILWPLVLRWAGLRQWRHKRAGFLKPRPSTAGLNIQVVSRGSRREPN